MLVLVWSCWGILPTSTVCGFLLQRVSLPPEQRGQAPTSQTPPACFSSPSLKGRIFPLSWGFYDFCFTLRSPLNAAQTQPETVHVWCFRWNELKTWSQLISPNTLGSLKVNGWWVLEGCSRKDWISFTVIFNFSFSILLLFKDEFMSC